MKDNPRRERFVREYLVDLNATQAAVRAGYSKRHAVKIGSRLLKDPRVAAEVSEAQKASLQRVDLTADQVVLELGRLALSDLSQAFGEDGRLLHPSAMPEGIRRAVASFEQEALFDGGGADKVQVGLTTKVKLWDKPRALEILAKHFKLVIDKVEHEITGPGWDQLVAASKGKPGAGK